ncbi:MAG: DDE-type integrase/transposase/recombinase, partial [Armatimonadetes bacterium]|nr:DDE-type integrase/transposase/recombinase [Armatimonadota bacterium]
MDDTHREEIATFRWNLIAPVMTQNLTRLEQRRLLQDLARQSQSIPHSDKTRVSVRTLERWIAAYRRCGFAGLKPKIRTDTGEGRRITGEILQAAMDLRRAVPDRSVRQIITVLEMSGTVPRGQLKRSTLNRYLVRAGYGQRQMLQKKHRTTFRRFEAAARNDCWQGDVCHLLSLPHPGQPGKSRQVYLIAFIDDKSRQVYGQMYLDEKLPRLEDCLKRTILRCGLPRRIYVDNGAIFSTRHLSRICGQLGIRLSHSRPYRPQGRGKVEKFFQYVEKSFRPEARALIDAGSLTTLAQLNEFFWAWLEVAYHNKPHGATKHTPRERFDQDPEPLRRIDPTALREVFLWEEDRTADKTACFSLHSNHYEVEAVLARRKVRVRYDPYDLSQIQVWHEGTRFPDAVPLELRRPRHHAPPP